MADEYIKREDALQAITQHSYFETADIVEAVDAVSNVTAADVRPVVRGRWDKVRTPYLYCQEPYVGICSVCQFAAGYNEATRFFKYCPNCGADMREEVAGNG